MYKTIIVPVDVGALDKGERILTKASTLLDDGGEIILVNVVEEVPGYLAIDLPTDLIEKAGKEAMDRLATLKQKTGINARTFIRRGPAAREIIALANENNADLIIVASHKPDLSNYLIGATADRVVRHSKCSVLVDR
ncbi:universal stress protein [Rhizobium sp. NRK18]|uniref:universal stress protein n=1 Tax=Rhizobium sp. NRK18 TaxID=2964667 RepID=UPI0021C35F0D|nr:universal stress protein [Rhizobium sp. NRK18]MCQ2004934.1 universal stress protein [Rhizobium sp. NRK18]